MEKIKIKNITFIHGDCMDFLSEQQENSFDLAIVDPPYGGNDAINLSNNKGNKKQSAKRKNYNSFENVKPEKEYFERLQRASKNSIIWGCNFFNHVSLPAGRVVWDKKGTAFGMAEMASCSLTKSVNIYDFTWNGMLQGDMKNKETRIHPTQKPVQLYKWLLINYAKEGQTILDTHGGSGSIAIACHDLGFSLTIIEKDREYFDNMIERFKNHIKQLTLF